MWRRVSCEQLLNTSQLILRLRGNLNQACGIFVSTVKPQLDRKGIWSYFQKPAVEPFWNLAFCHGKLWEELSFLHKPPRPWNPLAGQTGFGFGEDPLSSREDHEWLVGP